MQQDHLHGDRVSKHPAVLCHPKGGLSPRGHRTHVFLPPDIHHIPVYGGPSPGPVLQMLPKIQGTS